MKSELTVVVPLDFNETDIKKIDDKIGIIHDRHYAYGQNRDVVYYVREEDIDGSVRPSARSSR